jgi:uncharacterized protein
MRCLATAKGGFMSKGLDTTLTASAEVLSQSELQRRLREFKEQRGTEFHLIALGYFGSYARGEARPESDVDVVFETTHPNLWTTSIMKQDLEQWLDRPVDVIRLHNYLQPGFRARLEREAVYV